MKIKQTESSGSEVEYQYYCKKPSKQRKNKQKYYDYECYNDEDYCQCPRVKQNIKDDDNSGNKKDTKKKKKIVTTI